MRLARLKEIHNAILQRLRGGELTPPRLAGSVALGVFVGTQPIYGLHLPICTALSLLLGLDAVVAYVASNISIPPMIPVLLYLAVQLGSLLLSGHFHHLSSEGLKPKALLESGASLIVGSLLLGLVLALLGGALSYRIANRLWKRSPQGLRLEGAIARTVARYRNAPRGDRYYVASKLRLDPLTRELFEAWERGELRGKLLDAGSGRGQFSLLIAELGGVESLAGLDHDTAKVRVAQSASTELGIKASFQTADLTSAEFTTANVILLLDVLHYLDEPAQRKVLERASSALEPGGLLFLREANARGNLGGAFARFFERIGRALGVNQGEQLTFLSPNEYREILHRNGLTVRTFRGRGALANVLTIAERPAAKPL